MNKAGQPEYTIILADVSKNRVARLHSFIKLIAIANCLLFLINVVIYQQHYGYILLGSLAIFSFLYWFTTEDTLPIVSGVFIWTLNALVFYFSWNLDGLYDSSLLAYPCILMFCAMLNSRLLIISSGTFMVCSIYVLAYTEHTGLLASPMADFVSWRKAHNLALVLGVFSVTVYVLSNDLEALLDKVIRGQVNSIRSKKRTQRRALTNRLTQLPNEMACGHFVNPDIIHRQQNNEISALLILVLDNLNSINASLGFDIGDKLICSIAARLASFENKELKVFHSANNEFLIYTSNTDYHDIEALAHQILQATFYTNYVEEYEVEVSASIGIAIAPHDGETFDTILRRAHIALASAVKTGHNNFAFFDLAMETHSKAKIQMMAHLRRAIDNKEFQLYYQPKIELSTRKIVGAEALIRWKTPNREFIPPCDFIPIAEASGLINEIGQWVLERAISDCKIWHQLGFGNLEVAVNVSPVQFKKGNLGSLILKALKKRELDPSFLEVEITESLFVDDEENIQAQIHQVASQGVSISIDDFGTGYSNLNYLTKFNASTLKIDQSFVREMLNSSHQQHVVDAIIRMSSAMDIDNTAEGIEDEATATALQKLGCHYGQGYYWSRPVPQDEFCKLLKAWHS